MNSKFRIAYAAMMSTFTTGAVTFTLTLVNFGMNKEFLLKWFTNWSIAFIVAFTVSLTFASFVQRWADKIITKVKALKV